MTSFESAHSTVEQWTWVITACLSVLRYSCDIWLRHHWRYKTATSTEATPFCAQGYHVYQWIWMPCVGEKATTTWKEAQLLCNRFA